jgi:CheY-like chemotaxis protein
MKRILLIDDDPIFVFLLKKALQTIDSTLTIDIFSDGEKAISYLYSIKDSETLVPDIIFLDLNMPVLDGWGFLDEYSVLSEQLGKKIELYILSSSISPEDVRHASDYPVIMDYLIKPLEKSRIADILSHQ